jgi:hypothetical protein
MENEEKKEKKYIIKTCHICHGISTIETSRGDLIDCPNRSCLNGYIKIEVKDECI